jgi:hypothetical protein
MNMGKTTVIVGGVSARMHLNPAGGVAKTA